MLLFDLEILDDVLNTSLKILQIWLISPLLTLLLGILIETIFTLTYISPLILMAFKAHKLAANSYAISRNILSSVAACSVTDKL